MPANDRMDDLLEKSTELGVAAVQPLVCERSVLRLAGERADKKRVHWQGVVSAASEQSGRTRVPVVAPVSGLADWLASLAAPATAPHPAGNDWRGVLSLRGTRPLPSLWAPDRLPARVLLLSGPEGGLSPGEEAAALAAGFTALSLGARVLRADTAPLAALAWIGLAASC
jgi:16S rRNA (uracil1498-N3)-methyltransferase